MPKVLPVELRVRVLAAIRKGMTFREASQLFDVSVGAISGWRKLERGQGHVQPLPLGGDFRSGRVEVERATILSLLEESPHLTVRALQAALGARGLDFSYGVLQRFLKRHGVKRKRGRRRLRVRKRTVPGPGPSPALPPGRAR